MSLDLLQWINLLYKSKQSSIRQKSITIVQVQKIGSTNQMTSLSVALYPTSTKDVSCHLQEDVDEIVFNSLLNVLGHAARLDATEHLCQEGYMDPGPRKV